MDIRADRINRILKNKDFIMYQKENDNCEASREFCRHNLQHSLDVARIAYILNLENSLGFKKDIIYAAALLHDIGRWKQYKEGVPHNLTGAQIAKTILSDCEYEDSETQAIINAIARHCDKVEESDTLDYLIFFADKKSRSCFACHAAQQCKWSNDKKNHIITL